MNVDLSGLEGRAAAGAGRGSKKFAPKAFARLKKAEDTAAPAHATDVARSGAGSGPPEPQIREEPPQAAPASTAPAEMPLANLPAPATPASPSAHSLPESQDQLRGPKQPDTAAPIPDPPHSRSTRQTSRHQRVPSSQPAEPASHAEARGQPQAEPEPVHRRSASPSHEAAATLASMELVPVEAPGAPETEAEEPQPGQLNTRGKRGRTGKGIRRVLEPKQLLKPDMGTASLRQIVEYAAANDRIKAAEERTRLAAAKQIAEGAGEVYEEAQNAAAIAPPVQAYGVPQLVYNEDTGEVEQVVLEDGRGLGPVHTGTVLEDRALVNSSTYAQRAPNERWTPEDTDLFFRAVETFGIELSLIQRLFPGRSRKTVKAKFTREEKSNRARMNAAVEIARNQPPEVLANVLGALTSHAEQRNNADEQDEDAEPLPPLDITELLPPSRDTPEAEATEAPPPSQPQTYPASQQAPGNTQLARKRKAGTGAEIGSGMSRGRRRQKSSQVDANDGAAGDDSTQGSQRGRGRSRGRSRGRGRGTVHHGKESGDESSDDGHETDDGARESVPARKTPPRTRQRTGASNVASGTQNISSSW